jgi:hypothetical protein
MSSSDTSSDPETTTVPVETKRKRIDTSEDEPEGEPATKVQRADPVPDWLMALRLIGPGLLGPLKPYGPAKNGAETGKIGTPSPKAAYGVDVTYYKVPPYYISDVHLRGLGEPKDGQLTSAKFTWKGTWGVGLISDEMAALAPTLREDTRRWMDWAREQSRDTLFGYLFDREKLTNDSIKQKLDRYRSAADRMVFDRPGETKEGYIRESAFREWLNEGMPNGPRYLGLFRGEGDNETMTISFDAISQWQKGKDELIEAMRDVGNPELQALLNIVGPWGLKKRSNVPRFFNGNRGFLVNPATGRLYNADYAISEKNCPPREEPLLDGDFVSSEMGFRVSLSAKGKSIKPICKTDFMVLRRDPNMAAKLVQNAPAPIGYSFGSDPFAGLSSSSSSSSSASAALALEYHQEALEAYGFD